MKVFHHRRRRPSSSMKVVAGRRSESRLTGASVVASSSFSNPTCVVARVAKARLARGRPESEEVRVCESERSELTIPKQLVQRLIKSQKLFI